MLYILDMFTSFVKWLNILLQIGLLSDINLHDNPGLVKLLKDGETLDDLRKMSPEQILLRWVNYHLDK